jgi:hypothetical protein
VSKRAQASRLDNRKRRRFRLRLPPVKQFIIFVHVQVMKSATNKNRVMTFSNKFFFGTLSVFVFLVMAILYWRMPSPRSISPFETKILPSALDEKNLALLEPSSFSYIAVIDAGSSGCRAHVYRYGKLGEANGPLYVVPDHTSQKIKPGLSTFANKPQDSALSLAKLIVMLVCFLQIFIYLTH